ncbi:MAG: LPP20 family lipoprotein [Halobacteriovoraceae bacterium]|jgi:hypothetical protein|nr:LPP20 family lipoprotein [Halobacteriovoraceae bacterium]MBT5095644.1 LPP20 family lipoprotein [Halobacteriovoraceae bacterium]
MNRHLLFLLILVLASCGGISKNRNSAKNLKKDAKGRPIWISEPYEFCDKHQFCAVGEGTGSMVAESSARKNLAKVFETKIEAKFKVVSTMEGQQDEDGIMQGTLNEDVKNEINEKASQVLKGVEILNKFEDSDAIYALAVLDRNVAAKSLRAEMDDMDQQIVGYYKDDKRSSLYRATKLFRVRQNLNLRHEFLAGNSYPNKISFAKILARKRAKAKLGITIFVDFKELGRISEIRHLIIRQLLDNDFKVVTNKNKKHQYVVKGKLAKEKQYFNVKGFKRYKFMLQLKSLSLKGAKIGAVDFTVSHSGRKLSQAYSNAMAEIQVYIKEHLNELNID